MATYRCSSIYQVGLPGFDSMPSALNMLTKHERASYCNRYWEHQFKKVCFAIYTLIIISCTPDIFYLSHFDVIILQLSN